MPTTIPSGRRPYMAGGVRYDGATKDLVLNADGQISGVHPVDEGMALSLCVEKGSCPASPSMGNTLRKIRYLGSPTLAEDVRSAVMSAFPLSRLVADGKAKVNRIEHRVRASGLEVTVSYVNLLTADPRNITLNEQRLEWYA